MGDYISREAALEKLKRVPVLEDMPNLLALCEEWINTVPAADVVEVVHGEWENGWKSAFFPDDMIYGCSVCTAKYFSRHNYCPNCGAKMGSASNLDTEAAP